MLSGTNTAPHSQEVSSCSILKKELHLFSCFGLSWVFAAAQALVAASRSSSPAVVCQLLMAVASLGLSVGSRVCGLAVPGLSSYGSWALEYRLKLRCSGLVASKRVESSKTRDQTHASCIGRQILYSEPPRKPQVTQLF